MLKNFSRFAACSLLALSALAPTLALAQTRELSSRGELVDRIAAVVNDSVVLKSQLDAEIERITERLRERKTELPPRNVLRNQVLERLVVQEVQMQRADRLGMKVADEMLNGTLEDVAKRNNISFSGLPEALKAQGIDYQEFREEIRRDLTLQMLRQRDVVARINISPRELEQFLARQQKLPDQTSEYLLSHILISVPQAATNEQVAAREARAQEVKNKLANGEDFAQLAVTYSDSSTNVEGGALGWRKAAELPSIAADQIPKLKAGEITEAIRTPSGFHLFKLNEVRGGEQQAVVSQVHVRHILLRTNDLEDDNTVQQRLEKIRARVLGGEDFSAIATVTSADPGSAVEGGDLGWAGPGTFVPEFEKEVDALKENEITQPFKSKFGWHIVQLLGRRLHDATDDVRRNRAYAALREAKAEEETELWLRRLRDDAFVEYRL
ncbi:MAG: peptidylprolyl isomerase [Candidatus Obscuribacterales bacterium]|nr:peptidylprolyl isomerase [Steroidobacteraceae bacterium]